MFALVTMGAPADASVYFSQGQNVSGPIGSANLDGTNVEQTFIIDAGSSGVALDGAHIYWTDTPNGGPNSDSVIGRGNLDGTNIERTFITLTGGIQAEAIAVDPAFIYFTDSTGIGRANLDGTGVNERFIDLSVTPGDVAIDGSYIYWTEGAGTGELGRANLDGTGVDERFISLAAAPQSVAIDASHIYWTTFGSGSLDAPTGTIGRANLDGTAANSQFMTGIRRPRDIALDAAHIYWTHDSAIGRANLDATNVDQAFIPGGAHALAVDASPSPPSVPPVTIPGGPDPVEGATANVLAVKQPVKIKQAGAKGFVPLVAAAQIQIGSLIDARKGEIRVTIANGTGGLDTADFYGGVFRLTQPKVRAGQTAFADIFLFGGNFKGCPRAPRHPKLASVGSKEHRPTRSVRSLWGLGKGAFRTVGRFSSATVRGTTWLTDDRCNGTLTRVTVGKIAVRDFVKTKTIIVKSGRSYFAKAKQ